jgi:hypothetical protein
MFKPALAFIAALAGPSAIPTQLAPDPAMVEPAPVEFWQPPDVPFTVILGSPAGVHAACGPAQPGRVILACTLPEQRLMLLPNPCLYQHEYYARLLCHEQAHVPRRNGRHWDHAAPVR